MEGRLARIYKDLRYGFIKAHSDKQDYFFHKEDFEGNWHALVLDFERNPPVYLEFEPTTTAKGLRAKKVSLSSAVV